MLYYQQDPAALKTPEPGVAASLSPAVAARP